MGKVLGKVGSRLSSRCRRELHRGHVKALLASIRACGLAKNSVRLIRATLSVILGDAVEDGILQTNPALGVVRRGNVAENRRLIGPLGRPEEAGALGAGSIHDAADIVHPVFERRDRYVAVGETGATLIEANEPSERRESFE
jgi:hypothetical protein